MDKVWEFIKKYIIWIICGVILIFIVIPLIVYGLSEGRILSVGGTNDWAGFWGGYLGAIMGSMATIGGVYLTISDDRKKRIGEEKNRSLELRERRRLDIIPYLNTMYYIPKHIDETEKSNIYFVDYSGEELRIRNHLTDKYRREIEKPGIYLYVLNYQIKNIGNGSAGGIYIRIDDDIVVRNVALAQNEIMTLCFLFKVVNLKGKRVHIKLIFDDIADIGHYNQEEILKFETDEQGVYLVRKKNLSKPQIIQKSI